MILCEKRPRHAEARGRRKAGYLHVRQTYIGSQAGTMRIHCCSDLKSVLFAVFEGGRARSRSLVKRIHSRSHLFEQKCLLPMEQKFDPAPTGRDVCHRDSSLIRDERVAPSFTCCCLELFKKYKLRHKDRKREETEEGRQIECNCIIIAASKVR